MAKQQNPSGPVRSQTASAVSNAFPPSASPAVIGTATTTEHVYEGPVPPPDVLRGFEELVPGSADRLLRLAEHESAHRHDLEARALQANIDAQRRQLDIAEQQARSLSLNDTIGQVAGVLIAIACLVAAYFLAISDHGAVATAILAIPTAATIRAFFTHRNGSQALGDEPAKVPVPSDESGQKKQ